MKIISYSDLHLEFGVDFKPLADSEADLMVLAGDIIVFNDYKPLSRLLSGWNKPVLYVAGNHEYYNRAPMAEENERFKTWLALNHPNVTFLQDEAITIDGVNIFGGTMWTDFNGGDAKAMNEAYLSMNDYQRIFYSGSEKLTPQNTIEVHKCFVQKITSWFNQDLPGARVVITHHAPALNPNTKYSSSPIWPAFNSLDMIKVIEQYQPNLWIYGHTHECDNQKVGNTYIISNQSGYPRKLEGYECYDFDDAGLMVEV